MDSGGRTQSQVGPDGKDTQIAKATATAVADIKSLASAAGLVLTDDEVATFGPLVTEFRDSSTVEDVALLRTAPARKPGEANVQRSDSQDDPLNAWASKCYIRGSDSGPLASQHVAIKDNICVAGVPMSAGTAILNGFVPGIDAEAVTRILHAGASIVGKTNCESLCFSSGSHTSDSGPVRNPHAPKHSAGGSSSGNGVVLATGQVDFALGTDTAGSVRTPASACGVFGLKPTRGLTPNSGVLPIERTLDCVGPMARSAQGIALLLEALVSDSPGGTGFEAALELGPSGFRIGVVSEGFGAGVDAGVRSTVLAALNRLTALGNRLEETSIPLHVRAPDIWSGIAMEGARQVLIEGCGGGTNTETWTDPALIEAMREGLANRRQTLSTSTKLMVLMGALKKGQSTAAYARARQAALVLQGAYDAMFSEFDLLAMPTNPSVPALIPEPNASVGDVLARSIEPITNTCAANVTGHPAISVPAGKVAGLPVGLMFIAPWHHERSLIRIASAYQALSV